MAEGRRGLGRGLSALLGETEAEGIEGVAAPGRTPQETPIELIVRNPNQPRRQFGEPELVELADSIRQKGVLLPILVRPAPGVPGQFQIVAGERRWRAAQRVGLKTLPVIIRELDDLAVLEIAIIENVQRADLNAIEEALGYKALIERFGRTQDAVAQTVGKSRSHIANSLRLLGLPQEVQDLLASGQLSAGHARAIASTSDPVRLALKIVAEGLSVRSAEALARETIGGAEARSGAKRPGRAVSKDADTRALESDLSEVLGLEVEIIDSGGVGEVRLHYATLEQLDDLCRRLTRTGGHTDTAG